MNHHIIDLSYFKDIKDKHKETQCTNLQQFTLSRISKCRTHLLVFVYRICTILKILTHAADCCTEEVILSAMSQQCTVH